MRIDDSHSVHWIWPMKLITIFNFSPNSRGFWKERRRDVGLGGISLFLWRTSNNNFWLSVCTVVLGSLTWPQYGFVLTFCGVSISSYLSYLKIWMSLIFLSLEVFRSYFAFCAVDHSWHFVESFLVFAVRQKQYLEYGHRKTDTYLLFIINSSKKHYSTIFIKK